MKILKISEKLQKIKIRVENNDDLFYLKNFIEVGDFVKAKTPRTIFLEREGEIKKVGKKYMLIKIIVEKVEFQTGLFQLRISGRIVEAPKNVQLDAYHSIEVKPGKYLTITKKEWKTYQINRLKEAEKRTPNIMIVAADTDQSILGVLKNNRVEIISEIKNPFSLVYEEKKIFEYYEKVAEEILNFAPQMKNIILCGPGFAKDHIAKIIREKPEVYKKIVLSSTSSSTISGLNEIIKSGFLEKVCEENQLLKETKIIEDFFIHLKKDDGFAVFGFDNVKMAKDANAIDILLISEEKLTKEVEDLAKEVEAKGGKVQIISTLHDLGQQFSGIGGIGAILRFKLKWS
ncbi:MAG: mRNA surveillance protein pelota [Candidatus Aenigmarchaeota archaeon]|nr:mRNA surveillance protein pelota [Candidatus Aenigmarchaeota archaeon]MDW8149577.1 mRNA surveillance protein pelota [Candidatus Aenigmarchaeota archaeon]